MKAPIRVIGLAALIGLACAGRAQDDPAALRRRVRALAESGKLAEAEGAARAGGAGLAVPLGEVLVLRGRLAEAESTFTAAVAANALERRSAEAALAELAERRGDAITARRWADALVSAYEQDGGRWPSADRTAAGRAYVVLGKGDPAAVRAALRAFDDAVAADSSAIEPRIRLGDLFLGSYVAPDAKASYTEALRLSPKQPRALLGMANVLTFEGSGAAMEAVRASLGANPALVPAEALLARHHLDAEQYDSAAAAASRALAVDSTAIEAWAMLAATAWLRDDTTGYARARTAVLRVQARPASFYASVSEAVARHRRYAEAERFGAEGVALDSTNSAALGALGINQLRRGNIAGGRAHMERAFARDPFHVWYYNTLDLLDQLAGFRTITTGRFQIVAPPAEAALLAMYLGPLLEEAYDSMAARYDYRPSPPIRIELYRWHGDFSVRTVGLPGLGALGVSFGTVLVMDAPSARDPGTFNWGTTAWHELAHTFTLGLSAHRVPRWFSEGLSVLEERRARPGWGADPAPEFLGSLKAKTLLPVSRLNDGFVRPSHPAEIGFSYYQASLLSEMIEKEWGRAALVSMLHGYRDGLDTPAVFASVLKVTPEALATRFDHFLRTRFAAPLAGISPWDGKGPATGEFLNLLESGRALAEQGRGADARAALEKAETMFPMYAGPDAPALGLARLARERGDTRAAVAALARHNALDESALASNMEEAALREELGDVKGARVVLERLLWIAPYDATLHLRLAATAEQLGEFPLAIRERRAVVALRPSDLLEARYQLARTLWRAGQTAAARREILSVLEMAPGFEKAQALLLELRKPPDGGTR
jgi:tetratricopeptide (TPR) repeat protein